MHIIAMLLLLSVLILVHELGHFGVAKFFGLKVDRFGFGLPFGPTIYETKWGDTTICIHAFLLGGYVAFPDDDPDSDLPEDDYRRIANRPVWQRACVVSAGVAANIVAAFVLVLMVAGFSGQMPSGKYNVFLNGPQEGSKAEINTPFYNALSKKDKVVAVNGMNIDNPVTFIQIIQRSKKFDNFVDKNIVEKQLKALQNLNSNISSSKEIIAKNTKIKLAQAEYEKPIKLETKDLMIKYKPVGVELTQEQQKVRNTLTGKQVYISDGTLTLYDLALITADTLHPVTITVEREGKKIDLPTAYPNEKGVIGIKLATQEVMMKTNGVISAVVNSWNYLAKNTYLMIDGLVQLVTGKVPLENLHGIVAITKVGGEIIQKNGIWDGILLTALISMDLAIVNLLPIPALDGGHLMFLIIEKIIGRPVNKEAQEKIAQFGFMFLIGLMVFIIINDIYALIMNKI